METKLKLALLLLFQLINSVATREGPLSSKTELLALFELRSSLGLKAKDWPRTADPCGNWTGVQCQNGRVTGISLSGLRRTHLGSRNPLFAVDALGDFSLLTLFNTSGFPLPGPIPDWFGSRLRALQVLDLSRCSIIGPIPASLGSMNSLKLLYLSSNSLTGMIPSTLGHLSSLSVLDLSQNSLTGSIPAAFSALGNLTMLDLSSNYLSESIPSGLSSISCLRYLHLFNNSLTGSIPAQLGNLSQLVELDLGSNLFTGSVPGELGTLKNLKKLLVGNNYLAGTWSDTHLRLLTQLRILDVSGNNFTGFLSNFSVSFQATITSLNLSNNLFYGRLTYAVCKFSLIDLSGNYFQGSPPCNTANKVIINRNCFQNMSNQKNMDDCRRFYTKRGLAFDKQPTLGKMPVLQRKNDKRKLTFIMVGVFGGFILVILLVLVLVLLLKKCAQKSPNPRESGNTATVPEGGHCELPPKYSFNMSGIGKSFEYEQMIQVTNNFSDTNVITHGHSGDLFRAILEDGLSVVIKRVDLRHFSSESFMLELDLFRKVKHQRLVPLLGHSLENENEKFLVYKHMPNGDLSTSLYRFRNFDDDGLQSLDWITRLKIAIGAAECLSYLHHECNPPLVHRDIQASSILLDDKYEVRLGSLSAVCVQQVDNHQNGITRLLWMPETSETAMTGSTCTCSYDVYCFGKVLLELVTGKLGISKPENGSTEWLEQSLPSISMHKKELVTNIIDQSLVIDEDMLEEVWAMAIVAKSCLNPKPSKRPLMRHVLRALENPFKVVHDEHFCSSSPRLRTISSKRSWSATFFGSWGLLSSEHVSIPGQASRQHSNQRRSGSQGSGTNDHSSSNKRSSSEIFPQPMEMHDIEKQDEH